MLISSCLLLLAQSATPTPTATPAASTQPIVPLSILSTRLANESSHQGESLADVAKRIKLRMPAGQPRLITNENLPQFASGVELTTTKGGPGPIAPVKSSGDADSKKTSWQGRYREALDHSVRWQAEVRRLEAEVARLQNDFYSRDDPAQRDGVIKPAWDQALLDLQNARQELSNAKTEPDRVLEAAHRDGALPGWFRGQTPSPDAAQGPLPTPQPVTPTNARRGPI
jgi:hypothetical protein